MARKSNKTSHVLHLLSGEEPVPEAAPEEAPKTAEAKEEKEETAQPQEPAAQPESEPEIPNISIVSARDSESDPLADLIKEQLEEAFPEEILAKGDEGTKPPEIDSARTTAPAEAGNVEEAAKAAQPEEAENLSGAEHTQAETAEEPAKEPVQAEAVQEPEEPAQTEPASSAGGVEATEAEATEAAPVQPDSPAAQPEKAENAGSPPHYRFINVMEYIIKETVLEHMHKFDMCTCERCQVDTMALALTNCPSKYIVVDDHTVSPLLNYYSNKFMGIMTVELIKACTIIKENPRH